MKALKIILCLILSKGEVSEPNLVGKWTRLEASQFHYPVWLKIQPEKIQIPKNRYKYRFKYKYIYRTWKPFATIAQQVLFGFEWPVHLAFLGTRI